MENIYIIGGRPRNRNILGIWSAGHNGCPGETGTMYNMAAR